jgi:ubiquinone/menaquinone biosynthesis C-methylase UbiE
MSLAAKDWDRHVLETEQLAQTPGFRQLRSRILARLRPRQSDAVVDIGAGTGLLALGIAPAVDDVRAVDISPEMTEYLRRRAEQLGLDNVEPITATAIDLPMPDCSATAVVSNYVYHHLKDADKQRGLAEAYRVLRPGGRIVIGDMMFRPQLTDGRSRRVIAAKVRGFLKKGLPGVIRLLKNVARYLTGNWEQPADPDWWRAALERTGFVEIDVQPLEHEGGIVSARRPASRS